MNSLKINFDKEELEIDGTKITKPFIVTVSQVMVTSEVAYGT